MSSIDRIHATTLSMNDRFTIMQKVGGGVSHRGQQVQRVPAARTASASLRNRSLLNQLEQKHKLNTAMKIKRVRSRPKKHLETIICKSINPHASIEEIIFAVATKELKLM